MSDLRIPDLRDAPDDLYAEEDQATLDAIDAGIRASDQGQVVPLETVRKLIPEWISKYSLPTQR